MLYTQATPDSPATVLLDPNSLSKDGTVALSVRTASGCFRVSQGAAGCSGVFQSVEGCYRVL